MLNDGRLIAKIREVTRVRRELGWVEFKVDVFDPEQVASYVSALANTAAIENEAHGFVIWGVDDSGRVVGTSVDPWSIKGAGNEDLIPWLRRRIMPEHAAFEFRRVQLEGKDLVVLVIDRAPNVPVRDQNDEYVRVGSYTKRLSRHPDLARRLWASFQSVPFEQRLAVENVSAHEVTSLLDIDEFARQIGVAGGGDEARLSLAAQHGFVEADGDSRWSITNLGALTAARRLADFAGLDRKAVRFVRYAGTDPTEAVDGLDGVRGYLLGFDGLLQYIIGHLPRDPETYTPRRITRDHFPEIAVREIIANALIHQDLNVTGAGPLIELFSDRIEVSNPGEPLEADYRRLLDTAPRSRNEKLADVMRLAGICEERGRGLDKAILASEEAQVPAPEVRGSTGSTRATILGPRSLDQMTAEERRWTVYMHTSIRHLNRDHASNSTVRDRLGLDVKDASKVSRLLGDTVDAGLIRLADPDAGPRSKKYVPFWA